MGRCSKTGERQLKRDVVSSAIVDQITDGRLQPGDRLPPRRALEQRFGVTTATLQQAFDMLKRDGFVISKGRWGTFISEAPPCREAFALAFPTRPGGPGNWSRFYWALTQSAAAVGQAVPGSLMLYHDIGPPANSCSCRHLQADLEARRLAGLVFANVPYPLTDTPMVVDDGIPRVGIMSNVFAGHPHIDAIYTDTDSFVSRGLERLAAAGRRRLAVITAHAFADMAAERLREQADACRLELRPEFIQGVNPHDPQWVINCLLLLLRRDPDKRPDALLVTDDHFIPHVETGLALCGLCVPQDLDVVALANFPTQDVCAMPIQRLGFDSRELLDRCLENLRAKRAGKPTERVSRMPAVFEDEWYQRSHPEQTVLPNP